MILVRGPAADAPGEVVAAWAELSVALRATRPACDWSELPSDLAPGRWRRALEGAVAVRSSRPRLIHLLGPPGAGQLPALAWARSAGIPIALSLTGCPLGRAIDRALLSAVDAVGLPSAACLAGASAAGASRVVLVPQGVAAHPYDPPEAAAAGTHRPLRLLAAGGNSSARRRFGDACDRVRRAAGPVLDAAVLDGPAGQGAPAVRDRLVACDGLVWLDPGPVPRWSVLAAMAATRPVLAVGEMPDDVLPPEAAERVSPDTGSVAAALLRWLEDPELRRDQAAAGWHAVRRHHPIEATIEGLEVLWNSALGVPPQDRRAGPGAST